MANVGVEGARLARSAIVGDDAKRPCAREGTKSPESSVNEAVAERLRSSRATARCVETLVFTLIFRSFVLAYADFPGRFSSVYAQIVPDAYFLMHKS